MVKHLVISATLVMLVAACEKASQDSQTESNKQIARRLFAEVWSQGEVEVLDEIIGDNYVKHWGASEPTVGRDELKEAVVSWRDSFPDWHEEVEAIEACKDMVFVRWTESGSFLNDYMGIQANGKSVMNAAMGWIRFEEGKIVEEWTILDNWGAQRQLGITYPDDWLRPGWD